MSDWEPQMVVALFFVLGILLSIIGALWIEKHVEQIRIRRRRNSLSLLQGGGKNPRRKKQPTEKKSSSSDQQHLKKWADERKQVRHLFK